MNDRAALVIVLIGLLFLNACSSCKVNRDCTASNDCFASLCQNGKCVESPKMNCCGNGVQDAIEGDVPGNKCTCPQDYGPCNGQVGNNMVQTCVKDECVTAVDPKKVNVVTVSDTAKYKAIELRVTSTLNQTFNIGRDTFNVRIELTTLPQDLQNFKITSLELSASRQDQTMILAEREVDRILWATGSSTEEQIPLIFPTNLQEEELKNLKLVVKFSYDQKVRGTIEAQTGFVEDKYKMQKFVYANPDTPRKCPDSCSDNNEATLDTCSEKTNFFCSHVPIPNRCGNYRCDPSEDKCTCETDCGPCQGTSGDYMEYVCAGNKCQSRVKRSVILSPISKLDDRNIDFGMLSAKYLYDMPFSMKSSQFTISMELKQLKSGFSHVTITSIRMMEGDVVLAENGDLDESLDNQGDSFTVSIPGSFFMNKAEQKSRLVTLKVWYSYSQRRAGLLGSNETQLIQRTYTYNIGKIDFINPELTS
jgi:hypothetical protein